jgi:hypothetical protein
MSSDCIDETHLKTIHDAVIRELEQASPCMDHLAAVAKARAISVCHITLEAPFHRYTRIRTNLNRFLILLGGETAFLACYRQICCSKNPVLKSGRFYPSCNYSWPISASQRFNVRRQWGFSTEIGPESLDLEAPRCPTMETDIVCTSFLILGTI